MKVDRAMFLALLGAVLIVTATGGLGHVASERYRRRPEQLRDVRSVLQALETQISYSLVPLPGALREAGRVGRYPIDELFLDISRRVMESDGTHPIEMWKAALGEFDGVIYLNEEDKRTLLTLGECLGCSDREDQLKHIRLAVKRLDDSEVLAWEERRKNENLFRLLGVLGGLAVAILLL